MTIGVVACANPVTIKPATSHILMGDSMAAKEV
jgi:hypothetical protein